MKIKSISIALVGCAAVLLSSCVTDAGVWGASVGYSSPGFSTSVAWTNASYDVNGFPIYGYAYGRPVYGYTAAGAAIFSMAALTAWCYVPDWGPAPWYHGHHHHPHHCHHVLIGDDPAMPGIDPFIRVVAQQPPPRRARTRAPRVGRPLHHERPVRETSQHQHPRPNRGAVPHQDQVPG